LLVACPSPTVTVTAAVPLRLGVALTVKVRVALLPPSLRFELGTRAWS
jgi:hypothetical protein